METEAAPGERVFSPRQAEVLEAALRELVEGGRPLTMGAVAKRAACSKETLYKWFDDRDGLLTAIVRFQAARVQVAAVEPGRLDLASLTARLEEFAANWLRVIASETSIALNRVAIGQAGGGAVPLGAIVLENGRFALGRRLKPVLEAGRAAGLIDFPESEEAFRTFFGLFARDVQIRLLLGERLDLAPDTIRADARRAARQFLTLYGAQPSTGMPG
ncbi:MAG: TetR/AcrR family transcriptional regulator [Hyphomicrobiales bacterium]|uniref:TetR/AcrR family transcriptional regulator n=1 Tax=Rhabdaerophilum calidifontis TaxID=2604328 RepID=UPI00123A0CC6|nr:TetR/AcrR family transcriptional regulator [Rhabdaerophilum calidifontis]MCA1998331.1 TetR/AcrR family transcriptional regulator [Hyphomicrobiales bacterium]